MSFSFYSSKLRWWNRIESTDKQRLHLLLEAYPNGLRRRLPSANDDALGFSKSWTC